MDDAHAPSQTPDPLLIRAETLVPVAKASAKPARESAVAKYGWLAKFIATPEDEQWWEIVFTVAAVYIAAARLNNMNLGEARETRLMTVVTEKLAELNPNIFAAFEDCKEFFGRNFDALTEAKHEQRFIASDSIGLWVAWNMLDRAPETDEEAAFVRGLGVAITHGFFGWWG